MRRLGIPTYEGKVDGGLHAVLVNEAAYEEVDDRRQDRPHERPDQVEPVDELVDLDAGVLVLLLAEVVAGLLVVPEGEPADLLVLEVGREAGAVHDPDAEVEEQYHGLCAYGRREQAPQGVKHRVKSQSPAVRIPLTLCAHNVPVFPSTVLKLDAFGAKQQA